MKDSRTVAEFLNISASMSKERDLGELLVAVVSAARKMSNADAGVLYLLDDKKQNLVVEVAQFDSQQNRQTSFPNIPLYVDGRRNMENLIAYTAFMARSQSINDITRYSGFNFSDIHSHDRQTQYKTKSLTTIPLRNHKGVSQGVLLLVNVTDHVTGEIIDLAEESRGIVSAFAAQAAVAIDNAQLIEKNEQLINMLNQTNKKLEEENQALKQSIRMKYDFSRIIGESTAMQKVFSLLEKVIDSDATVLVRGDTGTGKEMIAQTLHYNSKRSERRFIVQNCAALPEALLESELFGYKKGAFSGADKDKKGLIELADGGTMFLDEIGDMPPALQAKLLRVLQDQIVRPLGAEDGKQVNVRFVAATHCDLKEKIEKGEFREDLFYRLNVFPITMPALKDRMEDLPLLIRHLLNGLCEQYGKQVDSISPAAMSMLQQYHYPGNVRDLKNILERAILMSDAGGHIMPEHLPEEVLQAAMYEEKNETMQIYVNGSLKQIVERYEARVLTKKLTDCDGNQTRAAQELNIGRRTLIDKIKRYGVDKNGSNSDEL